MSTVFAKISIVATRPQLAAEYLGWAAQRALGRAHPTRMVHGVSLGNFNGFSEYHSVSSGVSPAEKRFMQSHPFGQGVIFDVGANLGLFSLLMNKRFPDRRTIAFEPSPTTFAALQNNVARNRAKSVECYQMAVSDSVGEVHFETRENARANASLQSALATHTGQTVKVTATTLDTFCESKAIREIALLKVDVEGFETLVFRGAERVFTSLRPAVVYFEVCPGLTTASGFDPSEPAKFLAARGYALSRFGADDGLVPVEAAAAKAVPRIENWVAIDQQ